jgi:hypothetical protein
VCHKNCVKTATVKNFTRAKKESQYNNNKK